MKLAFENVQLEVKETHDAKQWYLTVEEVAQGYGVTPQAVSNHLHRHVTELRDGIEKGYTNCVTLGGSQQLTVIYREGVIKLGFFIRSKKAAAFRQWATNLIVEHLDKTNTTMLELLRSFGEVRQEQKEFERKITATCNGLRDEVDDLKEALNIFINDDETAQIRKAIKEVKDTTGLDGRAVIGHIRKTLDVSCVYSGSGSNKILNVLKNMIGKGIQLVGKETPITQ